MTVHKALSTVSGVPKGRTAARETEPVRPVDDVVVDATLPCLPPVVADMVRFERLTGCRPGEVCVMRPCDLDRSGDVWEYRPESHKTEHHGLDRIIYIGPQAQDVLCPYLLRESKANCFSPADSEQKRHVEQRAHRKSRVQPSQRSRRKGRPERTPKTAYTKDSYQRAIAGPWRRPTWSGRKRRQKWESSRCCCRIGTRTSYATPRRRRYAASSGLRLRRWILGHAKADVTQVYAERDAALAVQVAKRIG